MSDLRTAVLDQMERAGVPSYSFVDIANRRDRKHRNERIAAAAVALLLAVAAIGGAVSVFRSSGRERPAAPSITPENIADLGLAWIGEVPKTEGGVQHLAGHEGAVFASGDGGAYRFDEACGTGGASCEPAAIESGSGYNLKLADGMLLSAADQVLAIPASCRSDCSPAWTAPRAAGSIGGSEPLVADGLVLVPWQSGLYAYPVDCASDGSTCTPSSVGRVGRSGPKPWVPGEPGFYPKAWVAGHTVVVDNFNGSAFGFSTACLAGRPACQPIWKVRSEGGYVLSGGGDGLVFVATARQMLAFDDACVSSCSPVWTAVLPGSIEGPPVAGDGSVFVASKGELFAFSSSCGADGEQCEPAWTARAAPAETAPRSTLQPMMAEANGVLVLGIRFAGDLRAFAVTCGRGGASCEPSWTVAVGSITPVIAGGIVYAVTDDGHAIDAFDASCATDGSACHPLWSGSTQGLIRSRPLVTDGGVYVGTGDSKVVAFRLGAGGTAGSGSRLPITTILGVLILLAVGGVVIVLRRKGRALTRGTL
jgi:outer membrane protein assembly factor BamB